MLIEHFPFYPGLTEDDALQIRMAINITSAYWADRAEEHRKAGRDDNAATCERIRANYHRLWNVLQPDASARVA